jgi:O-antigen/teichoic acid export membrane protein
MSTAVALSDTSDRLRQLPAARSILERIRNGAFWSIVAALIGQSGTLFGAIICGRLLGPATYGQLGMVLSTVTLFSTLGAMGLGLTVNKHVAEYRAGAPLLAGRIIGTSFLLSIVSGTLTAFVMILSAPAISTTALHAPSLATDIRLGGIIMFFAALQAYQAGVLSGLEAFRVLAGLSAIRSVLTLSATVLGVLFFGVSGALTGQAAAALLFFMIQERRIRRECCLHGIVVSYRLQRSDLNIIVRYSIPTLIAGLAFTPATWYTNALLVRRAGFSQLGVFTAAMQWQSLVLFFTNAVSGLGLPILTSIVPERAYHRYRRTLATLFVITTIPAIVMAVPIALSATWVIPLVYGKAFQGGGPVLGLVCVCAVFTAANTAVGHAIYSLNAAVAGMVLALLRGCLLSTSAYYLVDQGAVGLAKAYVLTTVILALVQAPYMWHLLGRQRRRWEAA